MTLHEAIKIVLIEENSPQSAEKIAEKINGGSLYQRRDKTVVPANQVIARAKKYEDLFFVQEDIISLKHDQTLHKRLEIFKKHLKEELNTSKPQEKINLLAQFLNFQIEDWIERSKEVNSNNDSDIVEEPASIYYENKNSENLKIKFKEHLLLTENVLDWAFNDKKDFNPTLPLEIGRIIARLSIYKASNKIFLNSNLVWSYLLPIVNNFSLDFKFEKIEACENTKLAGINDKILRFLELRQEKLNVSNNDENIGILVHKGAKKSQSGIPEEFSFLIEDNLSLKSRLNKLVLVLPEFSLVNTSSSYIAARKRIIESQALKAVFTVPKYENTNINYSILIFDFTQITSKILFADFLNNSFSWNTSEISKIVNEKKQIKDVSKQISIGELDESFQLYPKKIVVDAFDFSVESGQKIFLLKNILHSWKRGINKINLKGLYMGGEIKFLRISDLNSKGVNFIITDKVLGIDYDELNFPENELVSGGIAISTVGQNLKATLLPDNEKFLLDSHLVWLDINENNVIPEYLVLELNKEYIQKQVNYFLSGFGVPKLRKKDLLNLRIKLPEVSNQEKKIEKELKQFLGDPISEYKNQINELRREKENFIKILKHTLKQRLGSLSGDYKTLSVFLGSNIENNQILSYDDITVPQFPGDKPEDVEAFKLEKVLSRMENALSLSHNILEKAEELLKMKFLEKEEIDLKRLIQLLVLNKPQIKIEIIGANIKIFADKSLLSIMLNNFFENAEKHGELKRLNGKGIILVELLDKNDQIIIEIRNNGKAMDPDFTIEDFLSEGNSDGKSGGSGFGGYLIGQILKKHNGKVELIDSDELTLCNVGFRIFIPKN